MGRNRKPGARYPSGKLKPAPKPSVPPITGAEFQRLVRHGHLLAADARLTSELGRLFAAGELTIIQCTAGHRIGEIYGAYERTTGLRRSTRSPSYERSYGAAEFESEQQIEFAEAARAQFLRLQDLLLFHAPGARPILRAGGGMLCQHWLMTALEQLCVEDRTVNPAFYPEIRDVLEAVAREYGLTKRGPAGRPAPARGISAALPPGANGAALARKPDRDRAAWLKVLGRLNPALAAEVLERIYDMAQAIKDRMAFVEASPKLRPAPHENTNISKVKTRISRPVLALSAPGEDDASG